LDRAQVSKIKNDLDDLRKASQERATKESKRKAKTDMLPRFKQYIQEAESKANKLRSSLTAHRKGCLKEIVAQYELMQQLTPQLHAVTTAGLQLYQTMLIIKGLEAQCHDTTESIRLEREKYQRAKQDSDRLKQQAREQLAAARQRTGSDSIPPELREAFNEFPDTEEGLTARVHEERARLECSAKVDPKDIADYDQRAEQIKKMELQVCERGADVAPMACC
jgi:hypothetical protein